MMSNPFMMTSSLMLTASLMLLFLLWRTNSLRTSIATTTTIVTVALTSLLHMFDLYKCSLYFIVIVMCVLVWRVIPHDTVDTWYKEHESV